VVQATLGELEKAFEDDYQRCCSNGAGSAYGSSNGSSNSVAADTNSYGTGASGEERGEEVDRRYNKAVSGGDCEALFQASAEKALQAAELMIQNFNSA
jgi:hypothetical protein